MTSAYVMRRMGSKRYDDIRSSSIETVVMAMRVATDDDGVGEVVVFRDGEQIGHWYRGAFGTFMNARERA